MARGWESKSVEAQQEELSEPSPRGPLLTPEERERERRRQDLGLMRKKLEHDLEAATNERYRAMLVRALADLDAQLRALGKG